MEESVATSMFNFDFEQVLTKFVEESGADFDQVADYLVAVSSTAVDDVQVGETPRSFAVKNALFCIWKHSLGGLLGQMYRRVQ